MKRTELVTKLELVSRALADDNMVPIFQNFMFDGQTVSAYNDHIGIVVGCETPSAFAVDGKALLGLLQNTNAEEATFEVLTDCVMVKTGKSVFKLPYMPEEDFMFETPEGLYDLETKLDGLLIEGLQACLMTVSKDEATQPAFCGVHIDNTGQLGRVHLYSSDSDAITRYRTEITANGECDPSYILSTAFCETVVKVWEEISPAKAKLSINTNWSVANLDKYLIAGRIRTGATPVDFAGKLKQTMKAKPVYEKVTPMLDRALSRARVLADIETDYTTAKVVDGKLTLFTDTNMGEVYDVVRLRNGHPDVEAKISAMLTQRSFGVCDEYYIADNCVVLRKGDKLLQLLSTMG